MSKPRDVPTVIMISMCILMQLWIVGTGITQVAGWGDIGIHIPAIYILAYLGSQLMLCTLLERALCQIKKENINYGQNFDSLLLPLPLALAGIVFDFLDANSKKGAFLVISAWLIIMSVTLIIPIDAVVQVAFLVLVTMSLLPLTYTAAANSRGAVTPWDPDRDTVLLVKMLSDDGLGTPTAEAGPGKVGDNLVVSP